MAEDAGEMGGEGVRGFAGEFYVRAADSGRVDADVDFVGARLGVQVEGGEVEGRGGIGGYEGGCSHVVD